MCDMGEPTIEPLTGLIVRNVNEAQGGRIAQFDGDGVSEVQAVMLNVECQQVTDGDKYSPVGRLMLVLPIGTVVQILSSLPSILADPQGLSYEQVIQVAEGASKDFLVDGHEERGGGE